MKTPNQTPTLQPVATPIEQPSNNATAAATKSDNVITLRQRKPASAAEAISGSDAVTLTPGQLPAVAAAATAGAAKGDDTVMSQPPPPAAGADDPKTKWNLLIGPAKLFWDKLTDAELQKTEGNEHRLATLVQARYAIPRGDAYRQVKNFHEKQKV